MAKCPKCGGELSPQENGLWTCAACGKLFRIKQKTTPESTQGADVPPVNESGADVPPVQTTSVTPAAPAQEERSQAAEIEELKRRLAEMEKRQSEQQPASHSGASASAAAVKFVPVVEFLKKYGLKVVLPVTLLVVAFITLCACFMGLRGIYVNVDNPNEFISFNATNYEWYYNSMLGETVDKGTWSKSGNTLNFVVDDELFGEVEDPYDVTNFSWDGFTLVDSFGAEKRYERVSLICYKDNISKVTVTFDLNGGTGSGGGEQKFRIGSIAAEPETPTRDGYIFRGWYTSADSWKTGEGRSYQPGVREWESATYYANWQSATQFEMYCSYFENEVEPFYEGDSLMDVFMRGMGDDGDTSNDMLEGIFFYEGSAHGWTARPLESDIAPAHDVRLPYISDFENLTIIVDGKLYSVVSDAAEYTIPDIVTDIGGRAFSECNNLTSVTFSNNVVSFDENAFQYCDTLTSLYYTGNISDWSEISWRDNGIRTGYTFYIDGETIEGELVILDDVTSIGDYAFYGCSGLTSVTIPDSVTSIGSYAFYGCTGLTSVIIPDSVTSIGEDAFSGCSGLTSITIPFVGATKNGTANTHFGYIFGASSYNYNDDYVPTSLKEVIITGGTSIGGSAFRGCTGLTSITIPDSVTSIGDNAFAYCRGLTSVTIPNSVTSIGSSAFSDCSGLTSVTIGNGVTSIGGYAFRGCGGLTSVTIPDSVTSIGGFAFSGCSGLTEINWNAASVADFNANSDVFYNAGAADNGITVTFGESVEKISAYLFYVSYSSYRPNIKSVIIGSNVTSIGESAFYDCDGLTSVTIGDSVTSIGQSAFQYCSGLTSVTIPDSVTSIGNHAFYGCSGLTSVTIPDSVTSIGKGAFYGCSGLTSITIPFVGATKNGTANTHFGYIFGSSSSDNDYCVPTSLKEVIITGGTSIGDSAFAYCAGLTSVTIPDSVTSIGHHAFSDCAGLTSITIPNSVTSIGQSAFQYCSGLTSVTIGDSVTSIGSSAFSGCTGLTSVTIGNGVTSIGSYAFYGCSGLTSVTFENTTGWYRASSSTTTSGTSLSSSSLSNPSTAAEWLRSTLYNYYWKRKV